MRMLHASQYVGVAEAHVTKHTVESVLEFSAAPELSSLGLISREKSIQSHAEQVVAQSTKEGLCVDEARQACPADFLLQLLPVQGGGVEQGRGRTARDVIAEKCKSIADDGEDGRDHKGTRSTERDQMSSYTGGNTNRATYGPKNS